jgi:hypothetical protein
MLRDGADIPKEEGQGHPKMTFIVGVILGGLVVLVWGAQEAAGKESLGSTAGKQGKAAAAGAAGRGSRWAVSPKAAREAGS